MAVGTVGGPLLGGFLTDALSWHWNFFVAIPFAIAALVMLQRNLHLPKRERGTARIDYLGIVLISGGVSLLLLWVTMAGSQFEWASVTSYVMVIGALALLAVAVIWELRVADPLIPLTMFRNRTFTLAVVASIATGVAMFGTSVFLSQYMQLARGASPMESGIMTIPMMAGVLLTSTVVGMVITKRGRWKAFVISGAALMIVGMAMLSTLHYDTAFWFVGVSMAILGAGVGMLMQNLVLVTQNAVEARQLGVATSAVTFFRSLGGTIGVSVMGTILGTSVADQLKTSIATLPADQQASAAQAMAGGTIPKLAELPEALRILVETAYGLGIGEVFLVGIPIAVVTLIAVIFLPNAPLGMQTAIEKRASEESLAELIEEAEDLTIESASAVAGLAPVGSSRAADGPVRGE